MALEPIIPDWPAPARVRALVTTRAGGVSSGPYASLNLGRHCGDDAHAVAENRRLLAARLPAEPVWLRQVHGATVADADAARRSGAEPQADAAIAREAGTVCAVLVADCMPVLIADEAGSAVGIAHAGWRGLCAGVIGATLEAMGVPAARVTAWLGPAIGPHVYEVGEDVRAAFLERDPGSAGAFAPARPQHWRLDLYAVARGQLGRAGVRGIYGGGLCTYSDARRFYSFRRDRTTGRMAALVWLD
ncbi:MAG: peptidoglycan editing factor PgeF [Betaproteobacteria bacterium]|nr:peptidoglycan editing factor PgeF [Betaproteobacteria bacterium]